MAELSLFLALVLAMATGHKLLDRERLAASAAALTGASAARGNVISLAAAAYEAVAALALLFPDTRAAGAALAAVLWTVYGIALLRRMGTSLDCGCNFAAREKPVDLFAVIRAIGLAALAAIVFFVPAIPLTILAPFAAFGFLALYLALGEIMAITTSEQRSAAR